MLQKVKRTKARVGGGRFTIVASRYNARYVDAMVTAACTALKRGGADSIELVRVPGAFEIPVVAAEFAHASWRRPHAVICLGVILRGETTHADYIGRGVTDALIHLQIQTRVPMIHEVLLLENEEQARIRCLSRDHNRGAEAAQTALEMASLVRRWRDPDDDVPF